MGEVQGEEVKMIDVQQQGPASENLCGAFVFGLCDDLLTTRESTQPGAIHTRFHLTGSTLGVMHLLAGLWPHSFSPSRQVPAANLGTPPRGTEKRRCVHLRDSLLPVQVTIHLNSSR